MTEISTVLQVTIPPDIPTEAPLEDLPPDMPTEAPQEIDLPSDEPGADDDLKRILAEHRRIPDGVWKDQTKKVQCVHCKKWIKNFRALPIHLKNCPDRILQRFFTGKKYLFTTYSNPRKKDIVGMHRLIDEYRDSPNLDKLILGAVSFQKFAGQIQSFSVTPLERKGSP